MEYYEEVDLPIYEGELRDFLPDHILDMHIHVWLENHIKPDSEMRPEEIARSVADNYSFEDAFKSFETLFPGKRVEGLFMGLPIRDIDFEIANDYVAEGIEKWDIYGHLMPPVEAGKEELRDKIESGGFVGFKPYRDFVSGKDREEVGIFDFVTSAQLEIAQEKGLIITLHIPRQGRLADSDNIEEISAIAQDYPNVNIILAHIGRAYCPENIGEGLRQLKKFDNIFYDLAMVNNEEVIEILLREVGPEKVMFGTDLPVAQVRGKMICINSQRQFVTREPYFWSLHNPETKIKCTYFAYEIVRALKKASERVGLSEREIELIFYGNGKKLLES